MVSGDLYFLITMWPRLRPGSYVMGPTHDLQHQQQQQQTRQDAEIHHTIQPPTAGYNNASHNSTTQHQLLLSDPRPQARTLLCPCRLQIFAATLSFQAAAQPSTYYKSALAEYFTNILHSRIFTHLGNYGLDPGPGLPWWWVWGCSLGESGLHLEQEL